MTIGDLIKNKDYDYIEYRLTSENIRACIKSDNMFAGEFCSKDGKIISLDGDTYCESEKVAEWKEWSKPDYGISNGLTVVVDLDADKED